MPGTMTVSILSRLTDLISPRACAVCGCRVEVSAHVICAACNMLLPRTDFARHPYDNVMAKNLWGIVPLEKAAALMRYEHGSQACNSVYGMKYNDHPDFCYQMGRLTAMELQATGFFDDIDLLMPVPLTDKRKAVRGYNQSEEMARGMADITRLPVITDVVRRTAFKGSQTSLSRWERQDNMKGAWELADGHKVAGKHVAIVDDVVTTGATIAACAKQLLKAGNVRISVVCLGYAGKG